MDPRISALGALFGLLAVGAGAFGAHALRDVLPPDRLDAFETACRYQMYHALALISIGAGARGPSRWLRVAGWSFVAGVVLFCGSLFGVSLAGIRWLGAVTPFGGMAFLVGWGSLAIGLTRARGGRGTPEGQASAVHPRAGA